MSRITQESIERVLMKADIVDIIGRFVELKKKGANYEGSSPFVDEKTPSFIVSPSKQIFKCFSSGKGGKVIRFLELHKGMGYKEAINYLAQVTNTVLEYETGNVTVEEIDKRQRAKVILHYCQELYEQELLKPENKAALDYLYKRGLTMESIKEWGLGFAPGSWTMITEKMRDKNWYYDAKTLGLITEKEETGKAYDFYNYRIIIPIYTNTGNLVGFGGRDVKDKFVNVEDNYKGSKYLNPRDSFYYNKSFILFGMESAAAEIRKLGFAILTEGYFDVISMQENGHLNTVAACGTALTIDQAKLLKRYTNNVTMMYDGDEAGLKAMTRNMRPLLAAGLTVKCFVLSGGMDPDDWARKKEPMDPSDVLDAIHWYAEKLYKSSTEADKIDQNLDAIAELISHIPSKGLQEAYFESLVKLLKLKKHIFKDKMKAAVEKRKEESQREERKKQLQEGVPDQYLLPAQIAGSVKWFDIRNDVENYQIFMHDNRIWSRRGDDEPYYFIEASNFSIKILQHLEHEKMPKKLVQMENTSKRMRIYDAPSENFTSQQGFVKTVTAFGNFNWKGLPMDYQRLISKLMDEMGDGKMIEVLGWQPEGFFAFNNAIVLNGEAKYLNEHGCVEIKPSSYYIPSGNKAYRDNDNKFVSQKRVMLVGQATFEDVVYQLKRVHREHAMNAILFTIASIFGDIVYDRLSFFPMMFFYGPPSTGKDQIILACQTFFGKPQDAIQMTGKSNTDKGKLRTFAQFRNMIVHLSEYKNGNEDTNLLLMGLWDRKGYVRGNIDSNVGTDSVPILSSVIFTGNYYPDYDALISRFVAEEMTKTEFNEEEKKDYDKLRDMMKAGYSNTLIEILKHRNEVEKGFYSAYKEVRDDLKLNIVIPEMPDRMIQNAAVMGAMYKIFDGKIKLPFSYSDWRTHIVSCFQLQMEKLTTGNVVSRFWDCFLEALRDRKVSINHENEYTLKGEELIINYNLFYPIYADKHSSIFRSAPQGKAILIDKIKRHPAFNEVKNSVRYNSDKKTSGLSFNTKLIPNFNDIFSEHDRRMKHFRNPTMAQTGDLLNFQESAHESETPF